MKLLPKFYVGIIEGKVITTGLHDETWCKKEK